MQRQTVYGWLAAAFLLLINGLDAAPEQYCIRLRKALIITPEIERAQIRLQNDQQTVSGLFLVQFTSQVESSWQVELEAHGVRLLRFVPDNAFVAAFNQAKIQTVRQLPFVRWVGEYRPEYRIHEEVEAALSRPIPPNTIAVRVLVAPGSSETELGRLSKVLGDQASAVHHRFGTILCGHVNPSQVASLASMPAVLWIEKAGQPRLHDEVSSKIVGGQSVSGGHLTGAQELGYDGRGVVVAVVDSGLHGGDKNPMHPDLQGRVDAFFQYGLLESAADEHGHGTHVAGIIAGDGSTGEVDENGLLYGLGVAPGAHLVAQRIFDKFGAFVGPIGGSKLTQDAVRVGAAIGSNSWGEDTHGRYDLNAAEFDALVRDADPDMPGDQPYILEFSAGNAGPSLQTIGSPAVAKNVIAVGASQNDRLNLSTYSTGLDAMADFSSRGPSEDGRIKPDLVAPGTWIASIQSSAATAENAWWAISENYQYQGGTSQAGPHVSGAAAVFLQYYRERITNTTASPALVKAALINAAADMSNSAGTGSPPNREEGWGRLDLAPIVLGQRRFEFLDQSVLLSTGQLYQKRFYVASRAQPLKITLAYTDVPGLPSAIPSLVNDLNLEVVGPDGATYHGNQFEQGNSVTNASSADNLNNVEAVHVVSPLPGEYTIRVCAENVPEDARTDTPATDQDFALVISGDLASPGEGILGLDRTIYRAPDRVQITLIDLNSNGQNTQVARVRSSSNTNSFEVVLNAISTNGVFQGQIDLAAEPSQDPHALVVAHDDQLEVEYVDLNPSCARIVGARIDLHPPELSEVSATWQFGQMMVTWASDELATATVHYGVNQKNLAQIAENSILAQQHQVTLDNVLPNKQYWFYVVSRDPAGNATTNNNQGQFFDFTSLQVAPVLLVNAYHEDPPGSDSVFIPIESYTSALDATGIGYEVWDVDTQGSKPLANDLRPFEVVIWRLNDSIYSPSSTLEPSDQAALQTYLDGGGSLLIASMELLTRLGDSPFRTNVLHVQSFVQNAGISSIHGGAYDPISRDINMVLDYSRYPYDNIHQKGPDLSDIVQPATNAVPFLLNGPSNLVAGVRYPSTGQDSPFRVAFLSFPLDAIPEEGDPPNTRADMLRNLLSFLAPGINGLGTIALDQSQYSIPGRVTVEVADANLAGDRRISVPCRSTSDTNGLMLPLFETVRKGLFRGSFTAVSATNPPVSGYLQASQGDQIWADYTDLSSSNIVRATAAIDTVMPQITDLTVEPSFEHTIITWNTSEPADALVQFGESTFLGRTAYRADLVLAHRLTVTGLMPDRPYYFQIVSRDTSGNVAVDDNQGKLYVFRTLKPLSVPWFDDLETPNTNWTVQLGQFESTNLWTLGQPPEYYGCQPHSPANLWGSNLNGESIAAVDTTLIGPAIELNDGNQATLSFWQCYDFTLSKMDILHAGRLILSTNDGQSWIELKKYGAALGSWEEARIDLTPFLGHVVRIGWNYVFYSLQASTPAGWMIDDISVTATTVPLGTVIVTNNLHQAQFRLSGPVNRSGRGLGLALRNAPSGRYIASFSPVPYYFSPPSQTNDLIGTNLVVFSATYTFPDTNQNQVSDLWEIEFFGGLVSGEILNGDTDSDGITDRMEFFAGTNPTSGSSVLRLQLPQPLAPKQYKLSWLSMVGYGYQVQASSDLINWLPVSDWLRASSASTSYVINATNQDLSSFRLQVLP